MRRKPINTSALGWIVFFCIACSPHGVWSSSLVFGVHPYLSSTELSARFTPLCDYLSTQLGQEVRLKIAVTFDALIDQLIAGKVDVAFMGSSNYVLLKQRCEHITLLGKLKGRQPYLRGALVVRHDSGINTVAQLAENGWLLSAPIPPWAMVSQPMYWLRREFMRKIWRPGNF